jgi:DNA-binding HxlR family transcriptional regulator
MLDRAGSTDTYDDVPLSALMRAAQTAYVSAVERAQSAIGCDDLPSSGSFIISAMNWSNASLDAVLHWMGVSKQAVSQSVDLLVVRGYLSRAQNPRDRRRVNLVLTDRGRAAASVAKSAIGTVDRALRDRVGARSVRDTRKTLIALMAIGHESGRRPKQRAARSGRRFLTRPRTQ